jgi:hypothetical protein
MLVAQRVLAALALLLGTAGLILSLTGAVGVWLAREPVTARATRIFERIETALDSAERHLEQARASLTRAAERLDSARQEQRKISQEPQPSSKLRKGLARTVQQRLSPEIGEAAEKLHTVTEAAVVVNSVLEVVGNIPFLSESGLDMDGLTRVTKRVADMGPAASELSRLLGDPPEANADAQFNRIDVALQNVQGELAEYEQRVGQARQRTEQLKGRTLAGITFGVVLLSAVCFWIALSQVSVLFHAWSWWKDRRHATAAASGGPSDS